MSNQLQLFTILILLYSSMTASTEVTSLVGYRFGDGVDTASNGTDISRRLKLKEETSYGVLFAWGYDKKRQGELLISHYTSKPVKNLSPVTNNNLSVTYAHVGGNVSVFDGVTPLFITGGLGFTHFSPENALLNKETLFSLNIGLASKITLSNSISIRVGSRIYATLLNSDSQIFCHVDNCTISISSDLWVQSEINAGITVSF